MAEGARIGWANRKAARRSQRGTESVAPPLSEKLRPSWTPDPGGLGAGSGGTPARLVSKKLGEAIHHLSLAGLPLKTRVSRPTYYLAKAWPAGWTD